MTNFDERKKGYEAKFLHDQNIEFKIRSKRNSLLGQWAGEIIKVKDIKEYIKEVRISDLEKPGDDDIIDKIFKDFGINGITIKREEIITKVDEFESIVRSDIKKE
tara:strand:- start:63 stop:377 length:315 start_codon:yes stop_codon:yes gene_type:complete